MSTRIDSHDGSEESMMRFAMVPVFVSDQDRALAFYRDKLGFEIVMDRLLPGAGDGLRWITVAAEGQGPQFILFQPAMGGSSEEELRNRVGIWTGIVFHADDIDAEYAKLRDRGVPFDGEPRQQPWGGRDTSFSDPDGNRFQLSSPG
jgi:catechol 2,3-dioxygenase-like lactoylglutathione lyase family enzyme